MTAISRKSIVAIRPDGSLAGYFKRASDLVKVLDVDWGLLRKALEEGEVYNGLKWMFEPDFCDKWMAGESMKFDKPSDYESYVGAYSRDMCVRRRIQELEDAINKVKGMREKKRRGPDRGMKARKISEVYVHELDRRFGSIREASREIGVPLSTLYRCAMSNKVITKVNYHVTVSFFD